MKCVCISCFDHYTTRMKSIVEFFREKGFDTTYIISDYQHYTKKRFKANYENVIQLHVPAYKKNISMNRLYSHYVFSKKVYKELCALSPDVIFCNFPPNSLVKTLIEYKEKHAGCKVIFDCYDMWPESFPNKKVGKLLAYPLKKWAALRDDYIEQGDLLTTVSQTSYSEFSKKYPGIRTEVIFPSIGPAKPCRYASDIKDSISFLYLGNINFITDIDLGIRFLSEMAKRKKTILHIIGEGQNKAHFVEEVEKNGVSVVSHGTVFNEDKKYEIFSQCNFGLNIPKKEIRSTMALKALEYMRVGLPFVNSGLGDNFYMVKNHKIGINLNASKVEETVDTILGLTDESLQRMSEQCFKFYERTFAQQNMNVLLDT